MMARALERRPMEKESPPRTAGYSFAPWKTTGNGGGSGGYWLRQRRSPE